MFVARCTGIVVLIIKWLSMQMLLQYANLREDAPGAEARAQIKGAPERAPLNNNTFCPRFMRLFQDLTRVQISTE